MADNHIYVWCHLSIQFIATGILNKPLTDTAKYSKKLITHTPRWIFSVFAQLRRQHLKYFGCFRSRYFLQSLQKLNTKQTTNKQHHPVHSHSHSLTHTHTHTHTHTQHQPLPCKWNKQPNTSLLFTVTWRRPMQIKICLNP